jgi:hypothetical protein
MVVASKSPRVLLQDGALLPIYFYPSLPSMQWVYSINYFGFDQSSVIRFKLMKGPYASCVGLGLG